MKYDFFIHCNELLHDNDRISRADFSRWFIFSADANVYINHNIDNPFKKQFELFQKIEEEVKKYAGEE